MDPRKEIPTQHDLRNLKEERVLYPACDDLLTPQDPRAVLAESRRRRKIN